MCDRPPENRLFDILKIRISILKDFISYLNLKIIFEDHKDKKANCCWSFILIVKLE